jgi:hypothetical protein
MALEFDSIDFQVLQGVSRWKWENGKLIVPEKTKQSADLLLDKAGERLAELAKRWGLEMAHIQFPKMKRGYELFASFMNNSDDSVNDNAQAEIAYAIAGNQPNQSDPKPANPSGGNEMSIEQMGSLLGADYARIHEFLKEQREEGKIVIITSNITGICHHTNDKLLPERGVFKPHMWTGYNYLNSWRDTMSQLAHLQDLLRRDGKVSQYEYQLRRPDNAFCGYSTDYYLCHDYLGDEVRIGVSRPEDWRLIEAA